MFSIVVFMSAMQQILIGAASSALVAGAVGYGSANYAAGESRAMLVRHDKQLDSLVSVVNRVENLEKRFDSFEKIVTDGQKESRDIAYQILREVAEMRKDTAINSTEIGAIKVDIQEIKENIK